MASQSTASPVELSSGDLLADRRLAWAMRLREEGDFRAAADLLEQTLALAPRFAPALFALGQAREGLGEPGRAVEAFRAALDADPADRLGAALQLARLGAGGGETAMSPAYVRALFDQYAPAFDRALTERLGYRAPALLREATATVCRAHGRAFRFARALDLGCGTGLAARAFAPDLASVAGVDLSPAMLEKARARGLYADLELGDITVFLKGRGRASADLVLAADSLPYVGELRPVFAEIGRVLAEGGLFAFTLEAHAGDGVILRDTLRYAHAEPLVRAVLADAGLVVLHFAAVSTRTEKGEAVPGFLVVAGRRG